MKKECNHTYICDAGYGKKRCIVCDKIIETNSEYITLLPPETMKHVTDQGIINLQRWIKEGCPSVPGMNDSLFNDGYNKAMLDVQEL